MNTFSAILLLFGNLGTTELIVILVVVLLLFGGRKIPELMHGIGKGVRSFKKGMNEIEEEINEVSIWAYVRDAAHISYG